MSQETQNQKLLNLPSHVTKRKRAKFPFRDAETREYLAFYLEQEVKRYSCLKYSVNCLTFDLLNKLTGNHQRTSRNQL